MNIIKKLVFSITSLILFLTLSVNAFAASWKFEWTNQIVKVPVNSSIEDYKDEPKATLYKNNVILPDADITYNQQGDWLCYLADVNTSKCGEYEVWYKAYDSKYKPGTCMGYKCKIKFVVYDDIAPSLSLVNDVLKIRRNSDFDPFSNVIVKDNYSTEFNMTYVTDIDLLTLGEYSVKINCVDEALNEANIEYKVIVYETVKPVITVTQTTALTFPLYSSVDLTGYFLATDEIDGDLTNRIDYPKIDTSSVGTFEYEVSVKNLAGLEAKKGFSVNIVDDIIPEINLVKDKIILDYKTNFENFDFSKYVSNIADNQAINYDNLYYSTDILNEVGTYEVTYYYNDDTYNVCKVLTIELVSYDKPTINCKTAYIKIGNYDDLTSYVEVIDESDPKCYLTLDINITNVDFYTAGNYMAEAYAINSSGISATVPFEVVVLNESEYKTYNNTLNQTININDNSINTKDIIYISIISFISLFILVYVLKEKVIKKSKK